MNGKKPMRSSALDVNDNFSYRRWGRTVWRIQKTATHFRSGAEELRSAGTRDRDQHQIFGSSPCSVVWWSEQPGPHPDRSASTECVNPKSGKGNAGGENMVSIKSRIAFICSSLRMNSSGLSFRSKVCRDTAMWAKFLTNHRYTFDSSKKERSSGFLWEEELPWEMLCVHDQL